MVPSDLYEFSKRRAVAIYESGNRFNIQEGVLLEDIVSLKPLYLCLELFDPTGITTVEISEWAP